MVNMNVNQVRRLVSSTLQRTGHNWAVNLNGTFSCSSPSFSVLGFRVVSNWRLERRSGAFEMLLLLYNILYWRRAWETSECVLATALNSPAVFISNCSRNTRTDCAGDQQMARAARWNDREINPHFEKYVAKHTCRYYSRHCCIFITWVLLQVINQTGWQISIHYAQRSGLLEAVRIVK